MSPLSPPPTLGTPLVYDSYPGPVQAHNFTKITVGVICQQFPKNQRHFLVPTLFVVCSSVPAVPIGGAGAKK